MNRVRRDVVLVCLRQRQWRMALTVLVMPVGYELSKSERQRAVPPVSGEGQPVGGRAK